MSATTSVPGRRLAQAITDVLPASGRLQKHDYPAAVLFELRQDGLRLAATDGHRLAVRDLPAQPDETGRVVITAEDASALATRIEPARRVTLTAGVSLSVQADGAALEIRAASDHYPDYESILARAGDATLLVKVADLCDRLADQRGPVVLDLAEHQASVNGARLSGRYKGADLRIGFNPAYLVEALRPAVGPEVILRLGGPLDPVTIRSADDGTLTWLVMPIRLEEPARA